MSSSVPTYTPVLRWKPAERRALFKLRPPSRGLVQPIIEVLPKNLRSGPRVFADRFSKELAGNWGQRPHFVCFGHVLTGRFPGDANFAAELVKLSMSRGIRSTPVLHAGLTLRPDILTLFGPAIESDGFALRVTHDDLIEPEFSTHRPRLFKMTGVRYDKVDLILDFRHVESPVRMTKSFELVERLGDWRSVIYLGGSFPADLSQLRKNEQHVIPRLEWQSWMEAQQERPLGCFGDYTIQHPLFREPPANSNFSASIRYTADDSWVVMRGEGVRNRTGPGFSQYPAQAQLLVERPEYKGPEYSAGDRYIHRMAEQQNKTGSAQTWLEAGINHHMELVVEQLQRRAA